MSCSALFAPVDYGGQVGKVNMHPFFGYRTTSYMQNGIADRIVIPIRRMPLIKGPNDFPIRALHHCTSLTLSETADRVVEHAASQYYIQRMCLHVSCRDLELLI